MEGMLSSYRRRPSDLFTFVYGRDLPVLLTLKSSLIPLYFPFPLHQQRFARLSICAGKRCARTGWRWVKRQIPPLKRPDR